MQVLIKFRLSQVGQKANLIAGLNSERIQDIEVASDAPEFQEVVSAGEIRGNVCILDTTDRIGNYSIGSPSTEWDHQPTVREVLDNQKRRFQEVEARKQAEVEERRLKTLAVLQERKTRLHTKLVGSQRYDYRTPDWPYEADSSVTESDEAKAWVAELDAAKEAAQAEAAAKDAVFQEEKRLKEETAKQKEVERRKRLGLREGDDTYAIEDGALIGVPCYESHKRGKNWMAIIAVNPRAPGGLDRDFVEKAKGKAYYMVPSDFEPGTPIEFGADYYSGSGRKSTERWYGYVVRVDEEAGFIVLHECATGKDAVKSGQKFAEKLAVKE